MDNSTLEQLAEFICGDNDSAPLYRKGSELTRFFKRAGINKTHDGSTRKWWTLDVLQSLNAREMEQVLKRLASPKEYKADPTVVKKAVKSLNQIIFIEGIKIEIDGVEPVLKSIEPKFNIDTDDNLELNPLPPPDFYALGIEHVLSEILEQRWAEAEKCVNSGAYLASIIIMGSLLEGLLFSVLMRMPKEANLSKVAPKDSQTGKVKKFQDWSLNDMIEVAHSEGWIDLDVKKFSHSLRMFRNLVHPYEQMVLKANPDQDTCNICWLVVQAAVNDLAKVLQVKGSGH